MNKVVTYARVSTDEQAKRGFSLADQDEKFTRWESADPSRLILARFQDDASGKNFNRPGWKRLEAFVKANRHVEGILVIVWDRLSRNATGAMNVIDRMAARNIEINAIEQFVDWSIPEQQFLLAVYITGAQVFNERHSIRVRTGMRQAMRQGCWHGVPPFGYDLTRDDRGRATLKPNDKAIVIVESFEQFSRGSYTLEDVRLRFKSAGLSVSKSAFHQLLRNPVYIGKVRIKPWKKEPGEIVQGLHPAIMSEDLFSRVQYALSGRKRTRSPNRMAKEQLPLRGFLKCHACGANLTGSGSRGKGGVYFYYHCNGKCPTRFKAPVANDAIVDYLRQIKPKQAEVNLFREILTEMVNDKFKASKEITSQLTRQIRDLERDMTSLDDKFVKDAITRERYDALNKNYLDRMNFFKTKKAEAEAFESEFMQQLDYSCTFLESLDELYLGADVDTKRQIVSSIFPQSLIFDGSQYRTHENNELISIFGAIGSVVDSPGQLSNSIFSQKLIDDVARIFKLSEFIVLPHKLIFLRTK